MRETRTWRLSRGARAAILTAHLAASAGWLGFDGALIALGVTGLRSTDPVMRTGLADVMTTITWQILIPLVWISLGSGIVLGLGTSWGVFRYWWLVAKSGIAVALTAAGAALLAPQVPHVLAGRIDPIGPEAVTAHCAGLVALLAAMTLSAAKPWGRTRRPVPVGAYDITSADPAPVS